MPPIPTTSYEQWWRFDEAAAALAARDVLAGLEFAMSGGFTFDGTGVSLNGSTGYGAGPVSFWANRSTACAYVRVVAPGSSGGRRCVFSTGYAGLALTFTATGALEWGNPQNAGQRVTTTAIAAGVHDVYVDASGSSLGVWVDGASRASAAIGFPNPTTGQPFQLGRNLNSGGAGVDYFAGQILDLATCGNHSDGFLYPGPVILLALPAGGFLRVPDVLAGYVDPAGSSTLTASVDYAFRLGSNTNLSNPRITTSGLLGGAQSFTVAAGEGSQAFPIARGDNNRAITVGARILGTGSDPWEVYVAGVTAQWALARFAPNLELGDAVSGLSDAFAVVPLKVPDAAAVFYRAATGPGATAYAPGSSWRSSAAAVQAEGLLPATGAYLAVQAQQNRRTYGA
jgi:hypothetical protein